MKKRKTRISPVLIVCIFLLAAALVLSLLGLRSAKAELAATTKQLEILVAENEQLNNLNQALRLQLDSQFLGGSGSTYFEEDYCSLLVDNWSVTDGMLSFDAFAQVFLTAPVNFTTRIELWRGDTVFSSQAVTVDPTEADTIFEGNISATLEMPEISAEEELQLWLMAQTENGDTFFACAATWMLEGDNLVLITG